MDRWVTWFDHAASLGFDWVYINPFHYPGFSGSLYAVKDYYTLNPLFLPASWPAAPREIDHLGRLAGEARSRGLRLMMDLVVNHTSKDSILVRDHPDWFRRDDRGDIKSPSAIDPADARRVTVWGDLAEVDNHNAPDREGLWDFWGQLTTTFARLGFEGFRCDAAYQVPAPLWRRLIAAARNVVPDALFFAETLGCRLNEIQALEEAGFDCLANSSKWWDFSTDWCLEQHRQFRSLGPSVSFPETHDTDRLAGETGGLRAVQEQRYLFGCVFSAGILMPIGYEYGFRNDLNVVKTRPEDWEQPSFDITGFIREANELKRTVPILGVEGTTELVWGLDGPVLCLRKTWEHEILLILINKDWHQRHWIEVGNVSELLRGAPGRVLWPRRESRPVDRRLTWDLAPCEIVLVAAGA
jgi:starch synthase (maltosyl-transferring)